MTKALTWNELAEIYNKCHAGRSAKTLPMQTVFEWAMRQENIFYNEEEETLHLVEETLVQTEEEVK